MILSELVNEKTFMRDVSCNSWEELVDIAGGVLVEQGAVKPEFLQSIKDTVAEFGAYMVLLDDIAFFHGRPEAGVNRVAMSLALLREPVYLQGRRILAAFVFAAVDKDSHIALLTELSECLQDDAFLALLRESGETEKIMEKLRRNVN